MSIKPRISVVTVVRNNAVGLIATIRSVLKQDRSLLQYIVIDGGSTDLSVEALKQFSPYIDIIVSEPDDGIYHAMNKAILLAEGEWLHFLNCDDVFYDRNTLRDLSIDLGDKDDVVYGRCINTDTNEIHHFKPLHLYWAGMTFDHQAAFVRSEIYKTIRYDTDYRISADFDFFSRARLAGHRFRAVPQVIARKPYRGGFSDDLLARFRERFAIARRHFPDKPIADQIMLEILNNR